MACCASLPYFVTSEREQYALITDDLLMYDSEDDGNLLKKCLALLTDDMDDNLLSVSVCGRPGGVEALAGGPLLNDCMWSAGMLPPDLKAATPASRQGHHDCAAQDLDVDSAVVCTAVDPSLISPCPHQPVTSSTGARHVTSASLCTDRDVEMRSAAAAAAAGSENECESSDEVDVVSVASSPRLLSGPSAAELAGASGGHLPGGRGGGGPVSVVRDLLVLPPACSLLARVTAMHNYSSSTSRTAQYLTSSTSSSASAAGHAVYSAPQSPSDALRHRLDRRCLSTPASPSPPLHNPSTTTTVGRRGRRPVVRRRRRVPASAEWSGSDDSDSGHLPGVGGPGKRAHHNVLERRRRDHLKYSFEALRAVVPGTAADGRVPKVAILRRAGDHLRHLTATSQRLDAEFARLKCLHQRWTYRLHALLAKDVQSRRSSLVEAAT